MDFSENIWIALSQKWLYAEKRCDDPIDVLVQIASLNKMEVARDLKTDDQKKAFWINLYNAAAQRLVKQSPYGYGQKLSFFYKNQIPMGNVKISLAFIEHGILRSSYFAYGFGYIRNHLAMMMERMCRVKKRDYRIHFALNCGAISCPPIRFYTETNIDQELEFATQHYLEKECFFDAEGNTVHVPRLFKWFHGDFGGNKGIRAILKKHNIVPEGVTFKLVFKPYDWNISDRPFAFQNFRIEET